MFCYYGIARRPDSKIGQVWVEAGGGRLTRQSWTGVTYTTDREAGEDTGRLNQRTPIPAPDGPLKASTRQRHSGRRPRSDPLAAVRPSP